jgi:3-methyladenine DNA glycosylase AlkD
MTVQDVLELLEKNKDPRGIENWKKIGSNKMNSYGIGLTKLKTLCKKIGRDHKLAAELWKINEYDVKMVSMLIDDPALVTEAQINKQVKEMGKGMFAHVFCTVLMAKLPFLKKKVDEWTKSKDDIIRRCGYLCLYVLAKKDEEMDDKYFESFLKIFEKDLQQEENMVKDAMNASILTIGMRNKNLNKKAIDAARKIGKVEVYYGDNSCQAVDCIKHLTGERIQKSFK